MPGNSYSVMFDADSIMYEQRRQAQQQQKQAPSVVPVTPPAEPDVTEPVVQPHLVEEVGDSDTSAPSEPLTGPVEPISGSGSNETSETVEGPSEASESPLEASQESEPDTVESSEQLTGDGEESYNNIDSEEEPVDKLEPEPVRPVVSKPEKSEKVRNPVNGRGRSRSQNLREADEVGPDVKTIARVPSAVVDYIEAMFPSNDYSTPMKLAAYIYVTSGKTCEVPQKAKDLASTWRGVVTTDMLNSRLDRLERKMSEFMTLLKQTELATAYAVFNACGLRHDNPIDSSHTDLLEPGMVEMVSRIREQTKDLKRIEDRRDGRIHPKSREALNRKK